jgi:hypothetical protein
MLTLYCVLLTAHAYHSPSALHAEETTSTLNYAARARNIKNKPVVQLDPRERLIDNLRKEVYKPLTLCIII